MTLKRVCPACGKIPTERTWREHAIMHKRQLEPARFGDKVTIRLGGRWRRGIVVDEGHEGMFVGVFIKDKSEVTPYLDYLDHHGVSIGVMSDDFKRGW